jgi:hypothetical protein
VLAHSGFIQGLAGGKAKTSVISAVEFISGSPLLLATVREASSASSGVEAPIEPDLRQEDASSRSAKLVVFGLLRGSLPVVYVGHPLAEPVSMVYSPLCNSLCLYGTGSDVQVVPLARELAHLLLPVVAAPSPLPASALLGSRVAVPVTTHYLSTGLVSAKSRSILA